MDTNKVGVRSGGVSAKGLRPRRGAITRFVESHHRKWHIIMSALAVVYVVVAIRNDETPGSVPTVVLLTLSALFFTEFALRLWDAPSRWIYLRRHWIDAVSCIPLVGGLRAIRLLRLLRIGFARRFLFTVELQVRDRFESGHRQSLWFLAPCLTLLWIGSAYGIWVLEHGRNATMRSFGDALYWSFITTTTVGYGDITPQTAGGKVIAGLLAFLGVGLIGFASARLTAFWLQQEERDGATTQQLQALHAEIVEVRKLLVEQRRTGEQPGAIGDVASSMAASGSHDEMRTGVVQQSPGGGGP